MVDAANIEDNFVDVEEIIIIAERDGIIKDLKVKICREGSVCALKY